MRFPVILGYGLAPSEKEQIDFWLAPYGEFATPREVLPLHLTADRVFFENGGAAEASRILEWGRPLLVISGAGQSLLDRNRLFSLGVSALWQLPAPNEPLIYPQPELRKFRGNIFAMVGGEFFRHSLRQILQFAGFDIRFDFPSSRELVTTLESCIGEEGIPEPHLIIVDLDDTRMDISTFFYNIRRLFNANPSLAGKMSILLTKDFSRPGLDIADLATRVRPHIRRVFHPREALCALLEAYLFHDENQTEEAAVPDTVPYRSLHTLLHDSPGDRRNRSPSQTLNMINSRAKRLRKMLPFILHYDYLLSLSVPEGTVFAPQP